METLAVGLWNRAVAAQLCGRKEFSSLQNPFICSLLNGLYSVPDADLLFKRAYQELSARQGQKDLLSLAQLAARVRPLSVTRVEKLLERAAELSDGAAKNRLAEAYLKGELGLNKDAKKAVLWFERAIQANNCEKLEELYDIYFNGIGVPQNISEAHELLLRGAKQGCAEALNHLGVKYLLGNYPCEISYTKAFHYFARGAEKNHPMAQFQMGKMLTEGLGCTQDVPQGIQWIQKSADQNWFDASIFLGTSYAKGLFHPQDALQAVYWHDKAFAELTLEKHAINIYSLIKLADAMQELQPEKASLLRELAHQRGGPPVWIQKFHALPASAHLYIMLAGSLSLPLLKTLLQVASLIEPFLIS